MVITILVLDERSLHEGWSWEFELVGQRAAGRGEWRRRWEGWRPFFPLGAIAFQSLSRSAARILRYRTCKSVSLRWPVLVPQALATFFPFQGYALRGAWCQETRRKDGGKPMLVGCLVFHKSSTPSHCKATWTRDSAVVPSRLVFLVNLVCSRALSYFPLSFIGSELWFNDHFLCSIYSAAEQASVVRLWTIIVSWFPGEGKQSFLVHLVWHILVVCANILLIGWWIDIGFSTLFKFLLFLWV